MPGLDCGRCGTSLAGERHCAPVATWWATEGVVSIQARRQGWTVDPPRCPKCIKEEDGDER